MTVGARFKGTLTQWNDVRGFGFITTPGQPATFVHITSFPVSEERPRVGERLSFELVGRTDGKRHAHRIRCLSRSKDLTSTGRIARATKPQLARDRHARRPGTGSVRFLGILALTALVAVFIFVSSLQPVPLWVPAAYALVSVLCFVVYALDKSAAVSGRRRVSEQTLHLLGVAGGWPGGLLAQQIFRHKTKKQSFQAVFWITAIANLLLFVALFSPVLGQLSQLDLG